MIHGARQVKHLGFIAAKRLRAAQRRTRYVLLDVAARPTAQWSNYTFDASRYRRSFLGRPSPPIEGASELPHRVFVAWTGDNELTPTRQRNLDRLRRHLGVPIELVTPANLHNWVVEGHPLRPGYGHLSLVHRSDYLRAYLLHHHGGGWADIKDPKESWAPVFDTATANESAWITGFRELSAAMVTRIPGRLGTDLALHHRRLVGMGSFVARSHTPLTAEWLREVERRVDYFAPQSAEFPGGARGEVVGYPVSWTDLLGKVLHPLQLKYLGHVAQDDRLLLDFTDYH